MSPAQRAAFAKACLQESMARTEERHLSEESRMESWVVGLWGVRVTFCTKPWSPRLLTFVFMIKYPTETTKGKASVGSGFRIYSLWWQGRHRDRKKRQLERPQQEATVTQSLRLWCSRLSIPVTHFLRLDLTSSTIFQNWGHDFRHMALMVVAVVVVMVGFHV